MQDFATHLLKFSWLLMNQKKGVISIEMQGPTHLILEVPEERKREKVLSHCYTTWIMWTNGSSVGTLREATKYMFVSHKH